MINYEITKVSPKQLFMQVRYYSDGNPDFWQNFAVTDFTDANVQAIATAGATAAQQFWDKIAAQPEEAVVTTTGSAKEIFNVPVPDFNSETQVVEPVVTETDTSITNGWSVRDKTAEELSAELEQWRSYAQITMRQTRLALLQQGLLSSIDAAVAALPEPDKSAVTIEWEYAAVVERSSPWVISMATALGLSDVQIDDLFKLAATL